MAGGEAPAPEPAAGGSEAAPAGRAAPAPLPQFARRTSVLRMSLIAVASAFAVETAIGMAYGRLAIVTDGAHALLDCVVVVLCVITGRFDA